MLIRSRERKRSTWLARTSPESYLGDYYNKGDPAFVPNYQGFYVTGAGEDDEGAAAGPVRRPQ